jgi:PAS domain S-box-containing protein
MSLFQRNSLRGKLAIALWGAALLAFVVVGAGLLLFQSLTLEQRARQIMQPYAQLVSVGADAAVAFAEPSRAQEILDTLGANPQILRADIFLEDGRLLASFSRAPRAQPRAPSSRPDGVYLSDDSAELLQALPHDARLRLSMGMDPLNAQTRQAQWILGLGVLVLLTVTLAQLAVLRRTIVHPIAALTETAERVRVRADYQHRVPSAGADEVARLGQRFNDMLGVIQAREDELRRLTFMQRTILDNAAYGIISSDPDGLVTSFNHAAERLLGYTAEEVTGKVTPVFWHDAREIDQRASELSAELGATIPPDFEVFAARPRRNLPEEHEWTFIRKDGARVPVLLSISALRGEQGQITGFVGLTYDLTERKQAASELDRYRHHLEELVETRTRELAQARDAAESANRMKSAFLANMSHELRTPLNAILGFAQILERDDRIPADRRGNLATINRSGKQLLALINDVLEISRIEAGRLKLQAATCELHDLLTGLAEVMEFRARDKGLYLRMTLSPDLPRHIEVDAGKLRQILSNLLTNAVKYTESGGIELSADAEIAGERATLNFSVRDTGVGIPGADLLRIFQPFYQTDYGVRLGDGTGLGLTICNEYAALMGGQLSVESELHRGSCFRLRLPVRLARAPQSAAPAHGRVLGLAPEQPPCRVLVAEDDPDSRELLCEILNHAGFQVKAVANGEEAVVAFQDWLPHFIWMDMRMPVLDGYAATRRIRALPGGDAVRIAALTASAFRENHAEIIAAGCDRVLSKPLDEAQLFDEMAHLLGLRYRYEAAIDTGEDADVAAPRLLPPAAQMQALRDAASLLDVETTNQLIAQIRGSAPALADRLQQLSDDYLFDRIVALCEPS